MILHAEYDHKPEDEGIKTVCGEDGPAAWSDSRINCVKCLAILRGRPDYRIFT